MRLIRLSVLAVAAFFSFTSVAFATEPADKKPTEGDSFADDFEISGTLTYTTDYVFQGLTQNNEHCTPQLGVELSHKYGTYMNVWTSLVDFQDGESSSEADWTLGQRFK